MILFTRQATYLSYFAQWNIHNYKRKLGFYLNFLPRCKDFFSAVCTFQILLPEALMTGLMTKESNIPSPLNCGIKADMALPFLNPRSGQPARRPCWRSSTSPATSWSICTSRASESLSLKRSAFPVLSSNFCLPGCFQIPIFLLSFWVY